MRRSALAYLARALERPLAVSAPREPAPAAAIIALGAGVDARCRLTRASRERVEAAAALWRLGGAPLVVTSGGKTRGAARSEAEVMAEELEALGVPAHALLRGEDSLTTSGNAARCAALLRVAEQPSPPEVWLVTQPFHVRRACWLFRRVGFAPRPWHIEDSLQFRDHAQAVQWALREYLAWAKALSGR